MCLILHLVVKAHSVAWVVFHGGPQKSDHEVDRLMFKMDAINVIVIEWSSTLCHVHKSVDERKVSSQLKRISHVYGRQRQIRPFLIFLLQVVDPIS